MRKMILVTLSIALISVAGYLSFFIGALLSTMEFSELFENYVALAVMFLSAVIGVYFLIRILQIRPAGLLPLSPFVFICLALGFFYDRIYIPEGFKLMGAAILLMLTGLIGARRVAKGPKNAKEGL
jgi:hypothetical protein